MLLAFVAPSLSSEKKRFILRISLTVCQGLGCLLTCGDYIFGLKNGKNLIHINLDSLASARSESVLVKLPSTIVF
ncbi:hypothetical protein EV356DRAFT_117006 [Viridothelium virens]|uniref:Uncharacterized protein n=1 Tax=Viridothelium virens TaxID=1048519 RepID=A0A6A6GRN0_VIRVR|nr:hypothetical protein EV356DRAFT_117006 [Viridothelium virens]